MPSLVDAIGTRSDFDAAIVKLVGEGEQRSFRHLQGHHACVLSRRHRSRSCPQSGPAVGVVYVTGDIVDGEAPRGTAGGTTIARAIADAVADNDDLKALVVRVDSGGGSVLASEEIRQALIDAKKQGLPVVASFGPVAASGGYWLSTAADEIYAMPSTITGSIGVFAIIPSFNRSLAELGHRCRWRQIHALFGRTRRAGRPVSRNPGDPAKLGRRHLPPLHRPRCCSTQAAGGRGRPDRPGPGLGRQYGTRS